MNTSDGRGRAWGAGANLPFVGRERELSQLRLALEGAKAGAGSVVLLAGEPGIGKTALCEQLADYAREHGGLVLVGHSYEQGSLSLPYLPFVEALASHVLACEPSALRVQLNGIASDLALIVPEIRQRLEVKPRPKGDREEDRWRLLQAVVGFLRNIADERPLLLVLEDLHWADRGSLDLLVHVARNLSDSRLLIIATYRDIEINRTHPLAAMLADLRRLGVLPRLTLRGLNVNDVQRLYDGARGRATARQDAEAVHDRTEGNPLFVQEVLRTLTEDEGEGGQDQQGADLAAIPEGLIEVIGRRLSRLSADCNQMLASAAVIGRDFDIETLSQLVTLDERSLEAAIEEAEGAGVIRDQSRPGALGYRFAHQLFRQALYEEMSAPRRLRQHLQVARALEARYEASAAEHAVELAEHFSQSTNRADRGKAAQYFELAADHAVGVFAYGEAVRDLDRALDALDTAEAPDKALAARLLSSLADLMPFLGDSAGPQRQDSLQRSLALYEELGDETHAAQVHASLGFLYTLGDMNNLAQSRSHLEQAEELLRGKTTDSTLLRTHVSLARVAWWEMRSGEALRLSRLAMEEAAELGDEVQWTAAAVVQGHELIAVGDVAAGVGVLQGMRERVNRIADTRTQTMAGVVSAAPTGIALFLLGDPTASLTHYREELVRPHTAWGQGRGLQQLRGMEAAALAFAGELNRAATIVAELPDAGGPLAPAYPQPLVAFWSGDWQRAESLWRKEMELNQTRGNALSAATLAVWLARVLAVRGDSSESEALLRAGVDAAATAPQAPLLLDASADLAIALAGASRREEATSLLVTCRTILAGGEDWRGLAGRVALAEAVVSAADGNLAAAESQFDQSITTFEKYSLPWAKAEALHLWGRSLFKARRRAGGLRKLAEAEAVYRDHGAGQAWIDRVTADSGGAQPAPPKAALPGGLTEREVEVLRLIAKGKSNAEIADTIDRSLYTVQRHVSNVLGKTGSVNRTEAAAYAHRHELI